MAKSRRRDRQGRSPCRPWRLCGRNV